MFEFHVKSAFDFINKLHPL